ncbi:NAD(+) synthase [Oceanobacillus luteolus]|uniref:NH(3)-dependent NAD(+) synthetase n=1 Tax=Oceanobacillus luteolus TaxID=1274358 RepID=A0ABW4HTS4_9BACI|nr:NAD(+) synthase [Oceanobacillus luteolus]MCM3742211.1 NAD(+) synthase [Oceanobacillus luteolus]
MEEQIELIVKWLRERAEDAKAKGLLVGVSGGLDSAVVANLIKLAYPDNSLGVIMPIQTSEKNIQDAIDVTTACGIEELTIDLTDTHTNMYQTISNGLQENNSFSQGQDQLANANLRARLRMSTLYTIAAHRNYLVVGTDNASEWYTGYFTKYGDGGVDILPLVDFTKTEVREMAKVLGVPEKIIKKVPSADLWEEQTDEMEMGITYAVIDAYLKGETIPEADKVLIESMHEKSQHKRESLPMYRR